MSKPRALVVGLGIAGMSAAVALREAGWVPVVVERSRERRTEGYFVGLFPEGKKGAEKLDVLRHLHIRNPSLGTNWQVAADGSQTESVGFLDQPGEPYAMMRGDIEAALWARLRGEKGSRHGENPVEVRFGTRPVGIVEQADGVVVTLEDVTSGAQSSETFDLVVGSDGLRSTVRELVFGEHHQFLRPWNAIICAFELDGQVPGYGPQDEVTLALPKRAAWVFPFSDRTPTALLTYRTDDPDAQFTRRPIETLREVYADLAHHPVVKHSLDTVEDAAHYLFDSVHSVHMPTWHKGRVLLLGDSAWCLTLYSGLGATASLRGGAALTKALTAHPDDLEAALVAWENDMRPFIASGHKRARILQHMFVPGGRITSFIRDRALSLVAGISRRR